MCHWSPCSKNGPYTGPRVLCSGRPCTPVAPPELSTPAPTASMICTRAGNEADGSLVYDQAVRRTTDRSTLCEVGLRCHAHPCVGRPTDHARCGPLGGVFPEHLCEPSHGQ